MIKLIWSPDELLASEAVEDATADIGPDAETLTLDCDAGIEGLEEAIFAGSLFASQRLVIVRNAQVLKKADVERLTRALSADTVPADVVVTAISERVPTQLMDALKQVARIDRLPRPRRGELVNWTTKRLRRHGVDAAKEVPALLVEAMGDNLRDIDQAIVQLALRRGKGGKVERAHVLQHFTPASDQPIWILFDAIVKHDGVKAFETLRGQLAAGDEPLPMLGALVSQVRGIMRTKSIVEQDPQARDPQIAKELGATEGRVGVMRRQCARLSWDWLVSVHRLLAEADFELKGGEDGAVLPPEVVMERVVAGALDAG